MAAIFESKKESPDLEQRQVFDRAALLQHIEGDAELMDEVLQIFLADCPEMMNQLREAIASADAHAIQFAAHAIKGAAANICALRVSAAASQLESMGRENKVAGCHDGFHRLETEFTRFEQALRPISRGQGT